MKTLKQIAWVIIGSAFLISTSKAYEKQILSLPQIISERYIASLEQANNFRKANALRVFNILVKNAGMLVLKHCRTKKDSNFDWEKLSGIIFSSIGTSTFALTYDYLFTQDGTFSLDKCANENLKYYTRLNAIQGFFPQRSPDNIINLPTSKKVVSQIIPEIIASYYEDSHEDVACFLRWCAILTYAFLSSCQKTRHNPYDFLYSLVLLASVGFYCFSCEYYYDHKRENFTPSKKEFFDFFEKFVKQYSRLYSHNYKTV